MFLALNGARIDDFADGVGYERDYNTAKAKALELGKPIMLLVVADYCPWCKKFERKTLEDEQINKTLQKDFVPIVIDKAKDKGSYPDEYNASLIPAIYFIDPKTEKKLYEIVAYKSKQEFLEELEVLKGELK